MGKSKSGNEQARVSILYDSSSHEAYQPGLHEDGMRISRVKFVRYRRITDPIVDNPREAHFNGGMGLQGTPYCFPDCCS